MSSKKSIFEKLGIVEKVEYINGQAVVSEVIQQNVEPEIPKENDRQENSINIIRLMSIHDIYRKSGLICDGTSTVYIIDNFAKALPDNLPSAVKRQSVLNLISASGMEIQSIIKDGKQRLQELGGFIQNFSDKSDAFIAKNETEIKKLEQQISDYKKLIADKKKLKQEQKALIEYETQRIRSIIEFIEEPNNPA